MLNAVYELLAIVPIALLGLRARDQGAAPARQPFVTAESKSGSGDSGARARHKSSGRMAAVIERGRARRAQRLYERREFNAWLQITAHPLW